jgi:hypothetical protein
VLEAEHIFKERIGSFHYAFGTLRLHDTTLVSWERNVLEGALFPADRAGEAHSHHPADCCWAWRSFSCLWRALSRSSHISKGRILAPSYSLRSALT